MNSKGNINFYFNDACTNTKNLFEEAIKSAHYGKVLYIMQEQIRELPELSQDLTAVNKHYLKMISFLYAANLESLIENLSSLTDWENLPCTIILDDLGKYCGKDELQNACGIVALLIDASLSCETILKVPCKIYISVSRYDVGEEYCNSLNSLYSSI